jgi:hypothetical protein
MLVENPNRGELTPEELESLKQLQTVIDQVISDGKVSKYEMDLISRAISADGKILVEEVELVRLCIREKIRKGLLTYDWYN